MFLIAVSDACAQGEALREVPEEKSGISREVVDAAIARLSAEQEYQYDERALDDPVWLTALRRWFRSLLERWGESPVSDAESRGFAVLGIILAAALIILMLFLYVPRVLCWTGPESKNLFGEGLAGEGEGAGMWGETGVGRAVDLAASGMLREAVSLLFRSTLRGLDNMGWIRYRKSAASRLYLRQLRRSEDLYPLFRDLLRRFELAYYSKDTPDQDDWMFLYSKYRDLAAAAVKVRPPSYMRRA